MGAVLERHLRWFEYHLVQSKHIDRPGLEYIKLIMEHCMRKYRNRLRRMKQFWSIRYFIRIPGGAWEVKKDLLHSCSRSS